MGKWLIKMTIKGEMELVGRAQHGDRLAIDEILESYIPFLEILALKYSEYGVDKDDLVQEGLMAIYKEIRDYQFGYASCFRVCVKRRIVNAVQQFVANYYGMSIDRIKRVIESDDLGMYQGISWEEVMEEEERGYLIYSDESTDMTFEMALQDMVWPYIDDLFRGGKLKKREYLCLKLYYKNGLSSLMIAKELSCSDEWVRVTIHQALKKIKVKRRLVKVNREIQTRSSSWDRIWEVLQSVPMSSRERMLLKEYYEDGLTYNELMDDFRYSRPKLANDIKMLLDRIEKAGVRGQLVGLLEDNETIRDGLNRRRKAVRKRKK